MGFNQAPALPYRNLGIVQDGDTASQAIEKDKYVIWKGGNYFAKTDILQGETFVVDTNLTEIPDGAINGIVDALNSKHGKVETLFEYVTSNSTNNVTDINKYRYIIVTMSWKEGTSIFNVLLSHIFPLELFKRLANQGDRNSGIQMEVYDSSRHYAHIAMLTENVITIGGGYGMSNSYVFSAYGVL